MKIFNKIEVPYYKHTVQAIYLDRGYEDFKDTEVFLKRNFMRDNSILDEIEKALKADSRNGGLTLYNSNRGIIIVLLYKCTNKKEMYISTMHELSHVVRDIYTEVSLEGSEAAAYLQGYLGNALVRPIIEYYEESNKTI